MIDLLRHVGLKVRRALFVLRGFYPNTIQDNLAGGCAIGSTMLADVLTRLGFSATLVVGRYRALPIVSDHAWVLFHGVIVDVTATQFGGFPTVYLSSQDDYRYVSSWEGAAAEEHLKEWAKMGKATSRQSPAVHGEYIARVVARVVDEVQRTPMLGPCNSPSPKPRSNRSSWRSTRARPTRSPRSPPSRASTSRAAAMVS